MEEAAPWVVWRGWTRRLGVEESGHAEPGSYGEQITCPVTELKIRNLLDGAHDRPASIFYLLGQPRGHKVALYLSGSELWGRDSKFRELEWEINERMNEWMKEWRCGPLCQMWRARWSFILYFRYVQSVCQSLVVETNIWFATFFTSRRWWAQHRQLSTFLWNLLSFVFFPMGCTYFCVAAPLTMTENGSPKVRWLVSVGELGHSN